MPNRVRNLQQPTPAARAVAKGVPPPSCAVLPQKEVTRIEALCAPHDRSEAERRAELRKVSDERVSHWPNTIEASRLKKERTRKERLEREEARRVLIDQEEAALQDTKKESAIRKANLMLYEENDRIKNFKSKLFLATVLDERLRQLAVKEEREKIHRLADDHYALQEAEGLRQAEAKEVIKQKAIKDRAGALKQQQLDQLEEVRQQKLAEREADRAEGREITRLVKQGIQEEKAVQDRKLAERKDNTRALVIANAANKEWKAKRHEREKADEAEILQYAALKDSQMNERKARVDDKFKAKLHRRQTLIDKQGEFLAGLKAAQVEAEMKAMRDFERERDEREAGEKAQRDRRQKEMSDFKESQRLRTELKTAKGEAERIRMQEVWKSRAEILIEEELEERTDARSKAEALQRFHVLQAQEKARNRFREKESEIEDGLKLQEAMKEEQDIYHSYINSVMGEYVQNGRDSKLVGVASRSKKPSMGSA